MVSGRTGRLPEDVIREASLWFVRLGTDDVCAADTAAWRRWLEASPQHRAAWDRVEQLGRQFGQVDRQAGIAVLDRPRSSSRRQALKVLSLALGAGGLTAAGMQWQTWTAALSTRVGERRSVTLDDGSVLTLNTDSAADVHFSGSERLVILRRGELHLASHADARQPARPLRVATPMGQVTALGTRYTVRLLDGQAWTAVTEGAVRIQPADGGAEAASTVRAGLAAYFDRSVVQPARPSPHGAAWVQGALYADNMRLDDFIDELGRHRPGRLACDPAVAGLRISGSFPLGDTDRILAAVERALPVRTERFTRYWVVLRARS